MNEKERKALAKELSKCRDWKEIAIEKRRERPFEGCIRIKGKGFTDKGFHDDSEKSDKRFIRIIKKLKRK